MTTPSTYHAYQNVIAETRAAGLAAIEHFRKEKPSSPQDARNRAELAAILEPAVKAWFTPELKSTSDPEVIVDHLSRSVTGAFAQLAETLQLTPYFSGTRHPALLSRSQAEDAQARLHIGKALLAPLSGAGHKLYVASHHAGEVIQVFDFNTALEAFTALFDRAGAIESALRPLQERDGAASYVS